MKKSVKILITSCVVALGVGASIGGAYALYQSSNDTTFSIGTYTHTSSGTITYKAGAVTSSLGEDKISPEHETVIVKVPLGAVYSNDLPAQEVAYGNLSVKATISSGLVSKVRWAVYMQGYKDDSYWATTSSKNTLTTKVETLDPLLSAAVTTVSKDVAVKAVETPVISSKNGEGEYANQWVEIFLDFRAITGDDGFTAYAGETFRLDVTFDKASDDLHVPYITGDVVHWIDAPEYQMVPEINKTFEQYYFVGLTGFDTMAIHNTADDSWAKAHSDVSSDDKADDGYSGYNMLLDPDKTYSVYSTGMEGAVLKINKDTKVVYQDPEH